MELENKFVPISLFKSKGTILHLFGQNKKFFLPFRNLIQDHFADGRHRFIVYGPVEQEALPPSVDTLVYPSLVKNFFFLSSALHHAEKIILHGLFDMPLIYALALQPWLLKKCYWVVWGGDLYVHEAKKKGLFWKKNELFRNIVIKRLGHLVTYIKGDVDLARRWYGATGQFHKCFMYRSNVYHEIEVITKQRHAINIQIGNSADPSNNHVEILERLMPYRDQDIAIYAPLSYGDKDNAESVIKVGKKMFGEKFKAINEFMPFDQYLEFLKKIDIAVFNHKRQQSMGNTIALLGLGKKVYMRSDVTPWAMFEGLGVKVFDIHKLDLLPLDDDVQTKNRRQIKSHFSEAVLANQLHDIFKG